MISHMTRYEVIGSTVVQWCNLFSCKFRSESSIKYIYTRKGREDTNFSLVGHSIAKKLCFNKNYIYTLKFFISIL